MPRLLTKQTKKANETRSVMVELFTDEWMQDFKEAWNCEPELKAELAEIGFDSVIGYGFQGDDKPRGVIVVKCGEVIDAGAFHGHELNWDLRASEGTWNAWLAKPPGMMGLGVAYTSGKLNFLSGDYAAMIKDPQMAGPFVKSFAVMALL